MNKKRLSDIYGGSDFLKPLDLDGNRPVVTITSACVRESEFGNGDHKTQICLELNEFPEKLWTLNITNARRISALVGTEDYERWTGKKIRLMTELVPVEGQMKLAIRVHPDPPEQAESMVAF